MSRLPLRLVLLLTATVTAYWKCAAENPPTGGPPDTEGPRVVRVEPPGGSLDLDPDQDIEIVFNEQVDPVSVPGSVVFTPEVSFTTRVRGRRVLIHPDEPYQLDQAYVLTLQRGIRDYQKNSLARSYQLVFSTGGEIPAGRVQGRIAESDPQRPVEVGLFARMVTLRFDPGTGEPLAPRPELKFDPETGLPVEIKAFGFVHLQSVDLAADGSFSFDYLPDGTYRLAAVEGGLGDFPAALHRRPYALPTADSLLIRGDTITLAMRRSPPLARPQMRSAEWLTPTYLAITFDTPFGDAPLPPNLYPTDDPTIYGYVVSPETSGQDTTVIDPGLGYTQLGEPYRLEPLAVLTPELVDTVPPVPVVPGGQITLEPTTGGEGGRYGEVRGRITFSEPVRLPSTLRARLIQKGSSGTGKDTLSGQAVDLPLHQESPLAAVMVVPEPERYDKVTFPGRVITDEAGNALTDSIVSFTLVYSPPGATGSIRGAVVGFSGRVVVEARDAATGQRVAYTVTDLPGAPSSEDARQTGSAGLSPTIRRGQTGYLLNNVSPGFYILFAHEQVGVLPIPYYSGRWEPYRRAARFSYYPEVVEVRPRWEVDGIDINFRVAIPILPLDNNALKRE